MAKILVSQKSPKLVEGSRLARNTLKPYHVAPMRIGQIANLVTVRCRKVVLLKTTLFSDGAVGSDQEYWHFSFHSGIGESGSLRLSFKAVCRENTKFDVSVTPDGGAASTASVNVLDSALDHMRIAQGSIAIAPDTLHTGFIAAKNGFRPPVSITLYEEHDAGLTPSAATTVDTRKFANKLPIYDAPHQQLANHSHNLYAKNGRTLIALAEHAANAFTRTSSTAVNMIDDTSTTVSSSSPGFNLHTDNLAPLHDSTKVPAVMKVYGQRAGGSGTNHVQLRDSSGTVAQVTVGTSLGWYTDSTVDLTPGSKYDVYYKGDSGFLVTVRSVVVYLWDE